MSGLLVKAILQAFSSRVFARSRHAWFYIRIFLRRLLGRKWFPMQSDNKKPLGYDEDIANAGGGHCAPSWRLSQSTAPVGDGSFERPEDNYPGDDLRIVVRTHPQQIVDEASSPETDPGEHALGPRAPPKLIPIQASLLKRYRRNNRTGQLHSELYLKAANRNFTDPERRLPCGWISYTHPEGALYFFNPDKNILTDANIYRSDLKSAIHLAADHLHQLAEKEKIPLDGAELVLEATDQTGSEIGYYFVDHPTRCVFWLKAFKGAKIFEGVRGVRYLSHARAICGRVSVLVISYLDVRGFKAQDGTGCCRKHCALYPNDRTFPKDVVEELRNTIVHAVADKLISTASNTPFAAEKLKDMLALVNAMTGSTGGKQDAHSVCVIAAFMSAFTRLRFFNFCGQIEARLDLNQERHNHDEPLLVKVFFHILHGTPYKYLRDFRRVCVDQVTNQVQWTQIVEKHNSEWRELIILGTVIMNANIAFLAVPGVITSATTRIISYISLGASTGSALIALSLVQQNSLFYDTLVEIGEAASSNVLMAAWLPFFGAGARPRFVLEIRAIIYSLPLALLIWGMHFFTIALINFVFGLIGTVLWSSGIVLVGLWAAVRYYGPSVVQKGLLMAKTHTATVVFCIAWCWKAILVRGWPQRERSSTVHV